MKRLFLLLIILSVAYQTLSSQTKRPKFYAIDGTEWTTKYDRDKKETLLWETIDLYLVSALSNGNLGQGEQAKGYYDAFKRLFNLCKDSFKMLREADRGKEVLQNQEFRFYLLENGIKVKTGRARNGEAFNMQEYAQRFNEVLREYSFNAEIAQELAKADGKTYNLEFVVRDFVERMEIISNDIESTLIENKAKESVILEYVPRYEAAKELMDRLERESKEGKKRQK